MRSRIALYRRADPGDRSDFEIGCRALTQPFFFEEADWISVPASWATNIVSFKTYNTCDADGLALWDAVNDRLNRPNVGMAEARARFGEPQLIQPRLGQGAFRVLVTDIYNRRCAVTRERLCQRSKPRIFGPTAMAANMRRETDSCFGVTSIACLMRAM
jgi:putative restriction endonuclease